MSTGVEEPSGYTEPGLHRSRAQKNELQKMLALARNSIGVHPVPITLYRLTRHSVGVGITMFALPAATNPVDSTMIMPFDTVSWST